MTGQDAPDQHEPQDWSHQREGDDALAQSIPDFDQVDAVEARPTELFSAIDYAHADDWIDLWLGDGTAQGDDDGAGRGEAFRRAADEASVAGDRLLANDLRAIADQEEGSRPWPNAALEAFDSDTPQSGARHNP